MAGGKMARSMLGHYPISHGIYFENQAEGRRPVPGPSNQTGADKR
jgi:hypothetical protein